MLLAELEVRHSRAVAPTRRVAIGRQWLPTQPAPGFGGILIGAVVGAHVHAITDDLWGELARLVDDLQEGRRISQPRLRHRFQTDVVGLDRSRHRLIGRGEELDLEIDDHARPIPQLLGALYAAAWVPDVARTNVFEVVRRALRWEGGAHEDLLTFLTSGTGAGGGRDWRRFPTDERWALQVLGFGPDLDPTRLEIQSRFRVLVREAHPDHGAEHDGAGLRILELSEARRILTT
jgi:hypothetical protein